MSSCAPELLAARAGGVAVLVWRLPTPAIGVSSAVVGGGIGERRWVLNAQVPAGYERPDPDVHVAELAAACGLDGRGVGMLTAADVELVSSADDGGARVDATVGLAKPTWAAADDE